MRNEFSKKTMKMAKSAAKHDKLGPVEKVKIKFTAKRDAKNSIPSPNEAGILSSVFIQKERESLGESLKELELIAVRTFRDSYITCDTLISSIPATRVSIEKLHGDMPAELTDAERKERKAGEGKVHDTIISNRRSKEHRAKNAAFYSSLSSAKGRLSSDIETLRNETSHLNNVENECISTAEKILCHHLARVEYYWRKSQPIRAKADASFPTAVPMATMNILRAEYEDYIYTLKEKRDRRIANVESVLKEVA